MHLELYSEKAEELAQSQERIRNEVSVLVGRLLERVGEDRALPIMLDEFERGKYWSALHYVDGSYHENTQGKLNQRAQAARYIQDGEREELGTLILNEALLKPYGTSGWPGLSNGHTTLLKLVVLAPDSIYHTAMLPYKSRLINGAFWESLPGLHTTSGNKEYELVETILTDLKENLDLIFAATHGDTIYREHRGISLGREEYLASDFRVFPDRSLDAYASWLKRLTNVLPSLPRCTDEVLTDMSISYVAALFTEDADENLCYDNSADTVLEKFHKPWLQSSLNSFPLLRRRVARECGHWLTWHGEAVKELIERSPHTQELVDTMINVSREIGSHEEEKTFRRAMPYLEKYLSSDRYASLNARAFPPEKKKRKRRKA